MILECLLSINYFQRTIVRQHEANKFTCELPLLFTVSPAVVCDSFVILAHPVVSCQQLFSLFSKNFSASAAPMSLTTVCGFLLFLLLFPVVFDDFAILSELSSFGKYFFTFLLYFYQYILFKMSLNTVMGRHPYEVNHSILTKKRKVSSYPLKTFLYI